jgi:hypothetical protein
MKTTNEIRKRKIGDSLMIVVVIFLITMVVEFTVYGKPNQNDTSAVISVSGKVLDKITQKPVSYANVYLVGSSIGTVTNTDGEFLIKVPKEKSKEQIGVTHLSYKTYKVAVEQLKDLNNTILLDQDIIPLSEVVIRSDDPVILLKGALYNIKKNYRTEPNMVTGFYRETVQQNKKYVSIAEAVLDAYKAPYANVFTQDRVRILIGRKSQDVKKMDTVLFKLQGGPITPFYLDVVKNPEDLISEENMEYYKYTLSGQVTLDNMRCYVISFDQREGEKNAVYKGKIYIETESLAIVCIEFGLSENGLEQANTMFVKKKPLTMNIETNQAEYYVKYAKSNGYWNLSYVRSELKFKCKWKKRLFNSSYTTMVEMAVTDIDTTNINKYRSSETTKLTDIFSEKVDDFRNDEYWGDYNVIKPDESIQSAIEKLNKKLKKK